MNHHRRIKWRLAGVACKAKKKLRVSIFSELLDGFLIAQAKPLFDEQRAPANLTGLAGAPVV
jgi:hypothetical protein